MRDAKERLEATLSALPDLMFEVDAQGRFYDYRTPSMEKLFVEPSQFLGKTAEEVLPPESAGILMQAIRQVSGSGERARVEYSLDIADRISYFEATLSPKGDLCTPEGRIIALVRDITERKQAEQDLQAALKGLREFEAIINRSPVVVFLWRIAEGWPVEYVSESIRQFGFEPDDLLADRVKWADFAHPEDIERIDKEVADFLEKNVTDFELSYRIVTTSGDVRWVADHTKAIMDSDGALSFLQGIALTSPSANYSSRKFKNKTKNWKNSTSSFGPMKRSSWPSTRNLKQ